jgi:hypothetical protein|tara:strand:+ start:3687 stop:3902 length:216 start_codon:yes stop_codon:yes gene_type:complete
MSFINYLKRTKLDEKTRWIVKKSLDGQIKEIKQLYNPQEYKKTNRSKRQILNKQQLIEILETDKADRKLKA